ncbi:MAG TPA: glycosyltransferase [Candidatus Saccharimonadaceae bacterium]|nr:glycosyltransferase [Candidatus Saccharimonadaceae bacterium]
MDLVVLAEVRWGYFRTRKQFLLSRFPKHWRVFYAQPPAFGGDDPWTPRREGNVTYFTVPFLKPGTTSGAYNALAGTRAGRAAIEWTAERWLKARLRALSVDPRPVVLTSNIYCARMLSRLPRKLLLYDFNDHPFQFAGVPEWARNYWRATLDEVDALFVVSEFYRRALSAETDRPLMLLGNGVEAAHFETDAPVPDDLARLPRPRIGYVGLLSHFLDFDALEAVRRARRGGTLVLIGPGSPATDEKVRALAAREGVAVLGPRPYAQIPAYFKGLDVGLIPFRAQDPFVQGINPNKVYQYLAAGLPVVTTPLLDLEARPPDLWFAADAASMVRAVEGALDAPADVSARRAWARQHDWNALAARMVGEIEARAAAVS